MLSVVMTMAKQQSFVLLLSCCWALAIAARPVDNIEHIIIFMQENRPFDHYFGTLNGVRGFNDRAGSPMLSGFSVFYQPTDQTSSFKFLFFIPMFIQCISCEDLSDYMLPFRVDPSKV